MHVLARAFVQHIAPAGVPAWLHEGLALLFEQGDEGWIDQHLRAAGRLPSLSSLEGGVAGLNAADAALSYAQSDVVFGGAIGMAAGRAVTRHGRSTFTMVPLFVPGGHGIAMPKIG